MPIAVIEIVNRILHIVEMAMEGQPPAVRAELWGFYIEDVKAWRAFFKIKDSE